MHTARFCILYRLAIGITICTIYCRLVNSKFLLFNFVISLKSCFSEKKVKVNNNNQVFKKVFFWIYVSCSLHVHFLCFYRTDFFYTGIALGANIRYDLNIF